MRISDWSSDVCSSDLPARVVTKLSGRDFRSDAEGIGIEMLTSGTTGTPKRVPLKAGNFSKMILDAAVFEKRDVNAPPKLSKAVTISNTPFSHIGGIFGLFVSLSAGRKSCMLEDRKSTRLNSSH